MGKVNHIEAFDILLLKDKYPVYVGENLLADISLLREQVRSQQVFIVTNKSVSSLYLEVITQAFADMQCNVVVLEDGEQFKNQQSLLEIYDSLISQQHHRDTTIFALGGGVIGDITALVASTYQRGVRLVHLPTTLLAQVDSSIGGKTAINHLHAKNMIGSFYHPHAVIMDVNTLLTLSPREFRAGFGEIIKYGLLVGGDFLKSLLLIFDTSFTSENIDSLAPIISKCCQIKASIVSQDECEKNGHRQLLNLGHTFAHALEVVTNYKRWLHGEAVAIGLYCAALLSFQLGYFSRKDLDFVDYLLTKSKLPSRIPADIDIALLQKTMWNDKKIENNILSFVLIRSFGDCYLDANVSDLNLKYVLEAAVC
jgi:3-dehydroquinate synthase